MPKKAKKVQLLATLTGTLKMAKKRQNPGFGRVGPLQNRAFSKY
jgi:hypothetical protein